LGTEKRYINFPDEKGNKHRIHVIPILKDFREGGEMDSEASFSLAFELVKVVDGTFFGRVKGYMMNFLRGFERKFKPIHDSHIAYEIDKEEFDKLSNTFGRALHDLIGEDVKLSVDVFVGKAKEFLKEYKINLTEFLRDVGHLSHLFLEFLDYALTGFGGYKILKNIYQTVRRKRLKLEGDVVFVVDDVADLRVDHLIGFLRWILECGGRIVVVKRLSFEEFMKVYESLELAKVGRREFDRKVFGALGEFVVGLDQVFLMDAVDFERFKEILNVNGYDLERVKVAMGTDRNDVLEILYRATAGSILTA